MNLIAILENKVLIAVLIGWMLAQALKIPTEYLRSRRWMWAMFFARRRHALVTFCANGIWDYGCGLVLRI